MPETVTKPPEPPVGGRESSTSKRAEAARAAAVEAAHPYLPLMPAWRQRVRRTDKDVLRSLKLELTTMEDQVFVVRGRGGGGERRKGKKDGGREGE